MIIRNLSTLHNQLGLQDKITRYTPSSFASHSHFTALDSDDEVRQTLQDLKTAVEELEATNATKSIARLKRSLKSCKDTDLKAFAQSVVNAHTENSLDPEALAGNLATLFEDNANLLQTQGITPTN